MSYKNVTVVIVLDTLEPLVTMLSFQLEMQKVSTMALTGLSAVYHISLWHSTHLY